jgi:sodium-dependent dicarboxylate transporter 2/3/5
MNWLQNSIIVVTCFLMARMIIDAGIHHHLVRKLMSRSQTTISALITGSLLVSYFLSLFFPNTIVILSLIPIIKFILEGIKGHEIKKKMSTHLSLALIYGANIGGMGSLTGSPLNLVYVGYIEVYQVEGRGDITFFSWLLLGIPATLVLILISRFILKIGEVDFPLKDQLNADLPEAIPPRAVSFRKYYLFFIFNILFIIILSALQFFYKPRPVIAGLNIIDTILLVYLIVFLFFAFIFPRRPRILGKYKKNLLFLLLFLILFPFIFIIETVKELRQRFRLKGGKWVQRFENRCNRAFNGTWNYFFRESIKSLKSKNPNAFVSLNRLVYDLPFLGLVFMGLVLFFVFLILKIGDNPETTQLDGYIARFFENLAAGIIPAHDQLFLFILVIVFIGIFMTEFINNTTVVFIMFPLVLKIATAADLNPLFFLLAVSTAASGAFMTPIATSVNAIGYAGIEGVSLKRMVTLGFLLNMASCLCLTCFFFLLNRLA